MADTPLTISKTRVSVSDNPERTLGYSHQFRVKFSDIACGTGNADTVTLTLGSTPTRWMVTRAMANVVTAFAGTTSFVMIVGTTSGTSAFLASTVVSTAGLIQPTTGPNTVGTPGSSTGSSSVVMQAKFTNASGGSPSALTAGELVIGLNIIDLDQIA